MPFNGQDDLIPKLGRHPEVVELYGKLTSDFFGGGRHSFQVPQVSKRKLAFNIKKAHEYGFEFNYLLNTSCLNNMEWSISGQRKMRMFVDWLVSLDIDAVTVAIPYLLEWAKKRYPELRVYVSDLAYVNSIQRAKYWEDLGADRITLFNVDVNRNFYLLQLIRKNVKCDLKLILNINCMYGCPFYMSHANLSAHSSQSQHISRGFVIDYCRMRCRYQQIMEPVDFIRSSWIRPEDVRYYEDIGIDYFKIIDRAMTTEDILFIVEAYTKRDYKGNLIDLFPEPSRSIMFKKSILAQLKYFLRPFTVNVFRLKKFRKLLMNAVYINNKELDGFIEKIRDIDCDRRACRDCRYCYDMAQKAVHIDEKLGKIIEMQYRDCLEDVISGDLFRYL